MNNKEIIKFLELDGWILKRVKGSHHPYMHSRKKGLVTVPHSPREMPRGTLKSIEKQAMIKLIRRK